MKCVSKTILKLFNELNQDIYIKMYMLCLNKIHVYSNHTQEKSRISLANYCYTCQLKTLGSVFPLLNRVFFQGLFVEPS